MSRAKWEEMTRSEAIRKANLNKPKRESSFEQDKRERSEKRDEYAAKPEPSTKQKDLRQRIIEKQIGDPKFFD